MILGLILAWIVAMGAGALLWHFSSIKISKLKAQVEFQKQLFEESSKEITAHFNRIVILQEACNQKDVLLERGAGALETSNAYLRAHQQALQERDAKIEVLEAALTLEKEQFEKLLHHKKSSEVRTGRIVEQISPFLADYPFNPETARFIGEPIDFCHFEPDRIVFVEVKSGKSQLSSKQREIRDLINNGRVEFQVFRIKGDDDDKAK